jgi:hypothetical protein
MANVCTICNHPNRLEIDRKIVEGLNLAKIAKEFHVPYHSIYQHSQKHITRQLLAVADKKLMIEGNELLETISKIITRAERIFRRNYNDKKDLLALKALDSQRNTIQLLSNISAQLHAAKIAELQLAKDSGEDKQAQLEQEYQNKIQILSIEELKVYQRLQNKILHQNSDIIILDSKVRRLNYDGEKK